ncbi:MAG: transposase zinc-binding domain-containing protein, partial [Planctomycetota bacterium]
MSLWTGAATIAEILRTTNNWKRYLAWKGGQVRRAVISHVSRMLPCRTPRLGAHLFLCRRCETVRVVPHSCKSVFCSSCGKVRTDDWCKELLSDLLDVPYRHLVFTIPWEPRLLIQDNRKVLVSVLFRAAADAVLSLTLGDPRPRGRKSRKWLAARKKHKPYLPGFMTVLHTFGSDLKWNPHLHMIVTAGGLRLDRERWVSAPRRYLVPA